MIREMRAALLLVAAVALSGCALPASKPCTSIASYGALLFTWPGNESALIDVFRDAGWTLEPDPADAESFIADATLDGTRFAARLSMQEGADGNASGVFRVQGYHGEYTLEDTRASLGPALEPLATRIDGHVNYVGGWDACA